MAKINDIILLDWLCWFAKFIYFDQLSVLFIEHYKILSNLIA